VRRQSSWISPALVMMRRSDESACRWIISKTLSRLVTSCTSSGAGEAARAIGPVAQVPCAGARSACPTARSPAPASTLSGVAGASASMARCCRSDVRRQSSWISPASVMMARSAESLCDSSIPQTSARLSAAGTGEGGDALPPRAGWAGVESTWRVSAESFSEPFSLGTTSRRWRRRPHKALAATVLALAAAALASVPTSIRPSAALAAAALALALAFAAATSTACFKGMASSYSLTRKQRPKASNMAATDSTAAVVAVVAGSR